jgi:hypothetical protein
VAVPKIDVYLGVTTIQLEANNPLADYRGKIAPPLSPYTIS